MSHTLFTFTPQGEPLEGPYKGQTYVKCNIETGMCSAPFSGFRGLCKETENLTNDKDELFKFLLRNMEIVTEEELL